MFRRYFKSLTFLTFGLATIFLAETAASQEVPPFNDSLKQKYYEELDRIIYKVFRNQIKPVDAVMKFHNSKFCTLYEDGYATILCTSLMFAADKTARTHGDGEFFMQALKIEVKKNAQYVYGQGGNRGSSIDIEALETARRLLAPQGGTNTTTQPSFPKSIQCFPNGSQVWCNSN